ncbi:hypothetical protein Afil01_31390 [Actinorhabdospora filicis]|uniref:AAA+ ATPase domain-containing protein n=1 Tax=Actinorhabdospora filicis TaxID=1785913 RepID=A0A9W6SM65_9ACTN|nr:TraM recognition domain-containing protein [Actinorhabdospora filicis]GLZ78332.1 hypothetical protein Afil01_31390 [Actinorhabdospora filicis]
MSPDPLAPQPLPDLSPLLPPVLAAVVVVVVLLVAWGLWRRHLAARHAFGGTLLRVQAPPDVEPGSAGDFFRVMTSLARPWWRRLLFGQPHIAFEYAWAGPVLDVRVWVPRSLSARLIADAIRGAWPAAAVTGEEAGPMFPARAVVRCGAVRIDGAFGLGEAMSGDPVRPLLAVMSGLGRGEHAVVQVVARPASLARVARLRARAERPGGSVGIGSMLADLLLPGPASSRRPSPVPPSAAERRMRQALAERTTGPMLEVSLRYAVASTRTGPEARLKTLAHALGTALGIHSGRVPMQRSGRHPGLRRAITSRVMHTGTLVTTGEAAILAHLPLDATVPQLARAGARIVPAGPGLPTGGRATKPLGTDAATGRKVAIPVADTRHHLHVVGSTGVGKSTFLLNQVLADIHAGRGVVLIDPKGDLVTDILARVDREALGERLVVIDPDGRGEQPGINPLSGEDPDLIVDHFVGICRRIFERHWGPRADDVLRSALLTVVRQPGATLEALPILLSDRRARAPFVADLDDDPAGLGGFWSWYDNLAPGLQSQVVGPVTSRIRAMLTRPFVRRTIAVRESTFELGDILNGGVLLVRVPKGQLGDDTARLLGSVIVARTWQAATARTRIPEARRHDATLYIDECHNFLTLPRALDEILAEARGYRLSLVLAHQHMAQLPRETQFAISANARTKVFFTTSPEDAHLLARHTLPHLSEHDLAHLEAYTAACRVVLGGREQPAFTLSTAPPPPPPPRRPPRVTHP